MNLVLSLSCSLPHKNMESCTLEPIRIDVDVPHIKLIYLLAIASIDEEEENSYDVHRHSILQNEAALLYLLH